MIYIQLEN